jgi:beta-glucanase (GH16 family)
MKSRRAARTVLALVLGVGLSAFGRCGTPEQAWTLAWYDEFEGPAGQSPDPGLWKFDIGNGVGGWGNNQWEYDTDRPENASLDGDGHLAITSIRENYQGKQYTSARLKTQDLFSQAYGRFEARMKLPRGQGLWPAFWMLGADFDTVGWPQCGEIDVMEYRGQEPQRVTGSLHGPGYSGGNAITASRDLPGTAGFDDDFHVFAVEWTPDWVAWELDGVTWQVVVPKGIPKGGTWVFDHPFFILLNVAVGGNYVGAPDPSVFPQTTLVDYVRVYEQAQ